MQEADFEDRNRRMESALERMKQGADVEVVEALWIESLYLRNEERLKRGFPLDVASGPTPETANLSPELSLALTIRQTVLDSLLQRGVLDAWTGDTAGRKRVFAAAASFACTLRDFAEAMALKQLHVEKSSEVLEKRKGDLREAGYQLEPPEAELRLLSWLEEHH